MCEQCSAKTINYVGPNNQQVLPDYFLVRATKDSRIMKKDDWGLVVWNDPDFIWSITPVCDPYDGLSDEQIEALPNDASDSYYEASGNLKKSLDSGNFCESIRLGEAMKKAGWNQENDGDAAYWLCNHIAKFLKTATYKNII